MKLRIATALLILVILSGFIGSGTLLVDPPVETRLASVMDISAVGTGELTATIDATIADHHPFSRPARALSGLIRFILFREGTGPVVIGDDGMLFTQEEFEVTRADPQILQKRIDRITRTARELQQQGQELVVVIVPAKGRVLASYVPRRLRQLALSERYTQVIQGLREEGVVVVDALSAMRAHPRQTDLFLRHDTHWTITGSTIVAKEIQAVLTDLALPDPQRGAEFFLATLDTVSHTGDLTVFVPLGRFASLVGIEAERITPVQAQATTPGDLFALPDIPVVLVGTSFSAGQLWSFPEILKYYLQADLVNLAEEGKGPFAPMERFLSEGPPEGVYPQVVIWEIPERYMTGQLP
jgi:alginate O-acetyltransferase complex protein AlgJ